MAERRVLVELRHSAARAELASDVLEGRTEPHLESRVVPTVEGVSFDPSFAPVELPAVEQITESRGPADVGHRGTIVPNSDESTFVVRGTIDDADMEAARAAARSNSAVVEIYSDVAIEPCPICPGAGPLGDDTVVADNLCVSKLHELGLDGSGVLVAIVDTGINLAHLRSKGKDPQLDVARSWVPRGGLTPGQLPVGHGTMCAYDTMIAAPNSTLLDIALLQTRRRGRTVMEGFLSDAVLAFRHLIDVMMAEKRPGEARSMVVNNSWGMFHPSWDFPVGDPGNYSDNPDHPFNRIVATLDQAGADILFAAGNCGPDCPDSRCRGVTANAIYGANSHPQVLSVAGVDVEKERVGYSSVGPGRLAERKPDLAGYTHFKGSGVYAADGGTSAATPVVAGVVAALRSGLPYDESSPESHPEAVRNIMIKTSEDAGVVGYDFAYGWGIVNGCRIAELVDGGGGGDDGGDGGCDCGCEKCCSCCCCCKKPDDEPPSD